MTLLSLIPILLITTLIYSLTKTMIKPNSMRAFPLPSAPRRKLTRSPTILKGQIPYLNTRNYWLIKKIFIRTPRKLPRKSSSSKQITTKAWQITHQITNLSSPLTKIFLILLDYTWRI